MAMINHQKHGDITRLSKNQRNVLQQYYDATSDAALKTTASYNAVRRNIGEEVAQLSEEMNLPNMMVFRRKGIRLFPTGEKVALYTNDKLGITVSIPYSDMGLSHDVPTAVKEESEKKVMPTEPAPVTGIDHIASVVKDGKAKPMQFKDGSSVKLDPQTAKMIHNVHKQLNPENKAKVERMLTHSKGQFMQIADFAAKRHAWTIK
jgi:hypothetical protein